MAQRPSDNAAGESAAEAGPAHKPAPSSPQERSRVPAVVAIGAGAVLGANARYLVGLAFAQRWDTTFPWHTMLVNVVGSFILGFYLTMVSERIAGRAMTRLFVATGFLGSFTTLSTFSDETVRLVLGGEPARAVAYAGMTLIAGLVAVAAGILLARVVRLP